MALVLISHDLGVVAGLADRIIVMYAGRIVEMAGAVDLFEHAQHPYTAELLKCIPSLSGPRLQRLPTLLGQPPRPGEIGAGCAFAPRCPRAAERCRAAALDCRHHLQLAKADMAGIGLAPCRALAAEDVRDLQRWTRHVLRFRLAVRRPP